jgi:hypothetical protein
MTIQTTMRAGKLNPHCFNTLVKELIRIHCEYPHSQANRAFDIAKEYKFEGKFGTVTVCFNETDFESV